MDFLQVVIYKVEAYRKPGRSVQGYRSREYVLFGSIQVHQSGLIESATDVNIPSSRREEKKAF